MHGTAQGQPAPLTTMGGLVTLANPESLPDGASPRLYDTDFLVGSVGTRPGLTSVYSYSGATAGPNGPSVAGSFSWLNPNNLLANDGQYTSVAAETKRTPLGYLNASQFAFNLSSVNSITGIEVTLYGYSNVATQIEVQLIVNEVVAGTILSAQMPIGASAPMVFGSLGNLWGTSLAYADLNNANFGIQMYAISTAPIADAYLDYATITAGITASSTNFTFITTFTAQDGTVRNLSLDANGNLWVENVTTTPGVLTLAIGGITPLSFATGVNGPGVEYLSFSNGKTGSDFARQYTPSWIDKVTQVGPGAAPTFTPISGGTNDYPVATITQPTAKSQGSSYFLQSGGPGSTAPGNIVTVYYLDSTVASGPDSDLVTAFNLGNAVYVYTSFTGGPVEQGPYTVQVTSVNEGQPPGQPRNFYYYTYQVSTVAYTYYQGSNDSGYTANYQRTLATMTLTNAVPGLTVGNTVTISGTSVSSYNNQWSISQALNSGAMVITETAVAGGVATYTYALSSGEAPTVGQLVTITNTTNANGALNLVNATVATATGGNSGSFTLNVSLPNAATAAEEGQATTAGTIFCFDPGLLDLGSSTNPIYGSATGGELTFGGSNAQLIGTGTRQGVVFFITRNGYYTAPSPPITFSVPANTLSLQVANVPIGPPNVIARGIAVTEAGQNGVPGANFFTLPTQVQYIVENVTYTCTTLFINDNTSTTGNLFFTDAVLLNGQAIDVYGYNLFNQIEIGNPGWIVNYASRNFYGLCQNKIQNFNNLSFDGGYLPGGTLTPLGWTKPDIYGRLVVSPLFGNSYYIQNTSGGTLDTVVGAIAQGAYQDVYQQPILNANTAYSVRITARIPSGNTNGQLVISLTTSAGGGEYLLPFSEMTTQMAIYTATLLSAGFLTVPADLRLNLAGANMGANADVEIDRIELFPTAIPVLTTTVFGSYAALPEQVDGVTGQVVFSSENQQPVNGAVVMYDTFYGLKQASMYSMQAAKSLEPADWDEPEVAQRVGAGGVYAFDFGEQWFVGACRNGLFLFEGGQPGKIMQEIYQVWNAINWQAAEPIWVRNDVVNRRLFVGVPLPTPNFWLPNAPVNTNPTTPNVILMLNYQGIDTGAEIKTSAQVHTTMFGSLEAVDMRRKWSIWQIPSPYAAIVQSAADQEIYICNGRGNSKVYQLDPTNATDDGVPITSLYTTSGFVNLSKATQFPMLGFFRKRWGYFTATIDAPQPFNVKLYPNTLLGPGVSTTGYNAWTIPGGFSAQSPCLNDREASLNFVATRTFLEFSGTDFSLQAVTLYGKKDTWNALLGSAAK